MTFRSAYFPGLLAILAAACGGAVFGQKDDPGAGGGSSASGGSASTGGSVGTAGSIGVAGSVSIGGGSNCETVDCYFPVCPDGAMPITPAGQCCSTCPPPPQGCEGVMCTPPGACAMGSTLGQPPGACCRGCVPDPGGISCPKIACGDTACPLGYVRGDLVGGCCTSCLPDPLFCNDNSECVIADRPRPCCGCPEAINMRQYEADPCWSAIGQPRMIPQSCQPQAVCDALCNVCPAPGGVSCANHRCTGMIPMSNGPR
jgi:hypothetical protein